MEGGGAGGRTPRASRARRVLAWLARVALGLASLALAAWSALALALDGPGRGAGIAFALVALALVVAGLVLRRVGPRRAARCAFLVLPLGVLAWWLSIAPSNERDWSPEVARLPSARVDGARLALENVRAFEYRSETEFVERWESREYDLDLVRGVDLALCDWGARGILHTILSFEFADGRHLAVSIETRKERGEGYSAVRGFFRAFELYYVVADERDVLGLRARFRGERLRLYRLDATPEEARALLLGYMARVDRLREEPAWYNAATANCTTTIRLHVMELGLERPFDWRLLANGHVDELLYERGNVSRSLPLEELRVASDVTEEASAALDAGLDDAAFSAAIRRDLPPRPERAP